MASSVYPVSKPGKVGGGPYHGSHGASAPRNWESRNAYDIEVPEGTPVVAVADGVIGPQIGSLNSTDPRFAGLRVHLVVAGNEFYYAHLSKLAVKAGEHVRAGQVIGYSGKANGVAHLHFAAKNGDPLEAAGTAVPSATSPPSSPSAPQGSAGTAVIPNRYSQPPPVVGASAGPAGVLPPGTVQADGLSPRVLAETWRTIAQDPWAGPVGSYAQTWETAAGGS